MIRTFDVRIWEYGRKEPITTSYSGEVTRAQVADFFGCHNPDVRKYEINEI